jgi:hypothetical protein
MAPLSAEWRDPTKRSAMSPRGRGAVSMMASGQREIGLLRISCIGTSSVVTSLRISSIGTSPVAMDSRDCPRPASSLAIAMPEVLGAIASLHPQHEKQCLLFFSALFMWLHRWHCHKAAARAADPSIGIPLDIEGGDRGMIRDRSEESQQALVASPSKIKEYYSYDQSYILDLWY